VLGGETHSAPIARLISLNLVLNQDPDNLRQAPESATAFIHIATIELPRGGLMFVVLRHIWLEEEGQDIAEYAVMVAVILIIVVGTLRLVGSNSNTVFSSVASAIG
jgi:Flp pilus assembly pilin Flp